MKKVTAIAAILAFATLLAGVVLAKDYDQPTPSIIHPTDEQSSAPSAFSYRPTQANMVWTVRSCLCYLSSSEGEESGAFSSLRS